MMRECEVKKVKRGDKINKEKGIKEGSTEDIETNKASEYK